ncbi:amino acid adenylation domain-containing protein [Mycobacterium sp. 94-17]|uniref:amino acid adenylation domain-containing protein n=1 Tax=Mycobacterium sp. 94-17 TaxID=2986147 RepID=UPI002D1E5FEB|nr:amino acid adenylation domain-containing protein [Mycobacterium sp. 94-17]MEB4209156.1 amino acid adenylation domain-containing protein [Mycobacterium sp. 94-17]
MGDLLHRLLERAARTVPTSSAVVDGCRTLSYAELNYHADRIADELRTAGVSPGTPVGLFIGKSLEAVVAIYGILKAGAAYLPLDVTSPPARIRYIVDDARLRVVLVADGTVSPPWPESAPRVEHWIPVCLRALTDRGRSVSDLPLVPVSEDSPAYVLYTSGSTGRPKGVNLSHRNALAFVHWAAGEFTLQSHDRLANHAPLHFDLSVFDLFAAAAAGATVVLVPPRMNAFPSELVQLVRDQKVTVWYSVPSALMLMESRGGLAKTSLPELRAVLFAGEVFPLPVLRRLQNALPQAAFYNLFGPTETNVCLFYRVPRDLPRSWTTLPIGRPIAGVECFALNGENSPVRADEEGELWVRGPTVMLGYLHDDAHTRAVLTVPAGGEEIGYRTGDIVSRDAAGMWNFLGRKDTQLKSRGYRIDLREIEAAFYQSGKVVECAVIAVPNGILGFDFAAFAVVTEGATEGDLFAHCRGLLPDYMMPSSIEFCAALPKTTTGKLDYRALAKSVG